MRLPFSQSIGGDGGTTVPYTQGFKARMIQRMAGPEGITANTLSREVGVAQPTLSRWLREGSLAQMTDETAKQRRMWTPAQKLRVVQQTSQLTDDELGAFLRREGVHTSQLNEWLEVVKTASLAALTPSKRSRAKKSPEQKKIHALEKELNRKDRALAEVTAILVLKKRIQEIWGDADDDTDTRSGT